MDGYVGMYEVVEADELHFQPHQSPEAQLGALKEQEEFCHGGQSGKPGVFKQKEVRCSCFLKIIAPSGGKINSKAGKHCGT